MSHALLWLMLESSSAPPPPQLPETLGFRLRLPATSPRYLNLKWDGHGSTLTGCFASVTGCRKTKSIQVPADARNALVALWAEWARTGSTAAAGSADGQAIDWNEGKNCENGSIDVRLACWFFESFKGEQ